MYIQTALARKSLLELPFDVRATEAGISTNAKELRDIKPE